MKTHQKFTLPIRALAFGAVVFLTLSGCGDRSTSPGKNSVWKSTEEAKSYIETAKISGDSFDRYKATK
ncbi:MAG TPA: hypothetical protein VKX17_08065 [Planctomycetota bacterium]|nr:hypothetical protein [Planctomycetota bacterium]